MPVVQVGGQAEHPGNVLTVNVYELLDDPHPDLPVFPADVGHVGPVGQHFSIFATVMSLFRRTSMCVTVMSRLIPATPGKLRSRTDSRGLVNTQANSSSARSSSACSASALSPPDGPVTNAQLPR